MSGISARTRMRAPVPERAHARACAQARANSEVHGRCTGARAQAVLAVAWARCKRASWSATTLIQCCPHVRVRVRRLCWRLLTCCKRASWSAALTYGSQSRRFCSGPCGKLCAARAHACTRALKAHARACPRRNLGRCGLFCVPRARTHEDTRTTHTRRHAHRSCSHCPLLQLRTVR